MFYAPIFCAFSVYARALEAWQACACDDSMTLPVHFSLINLSEVSFRAGVIRSLYPVNGLSMVVVVVKRQMGTSKSQDCGWIRSIVCYTRSFSKSVS